MATDLIPVEGMDPYQVLGVTPSAAIEEIEARYHLLLRQHHPDLHQGEGDEAMRRAEAATRDLNGAMASIRHHRADRGTRRSGPAWAGPNPAGAPDGATASWPPGPDFDPNPMTDWFGQPLHHHPHEPVPCPFCGRPYERLDDFEFHLADKHRYRNTPHRAPRPKGRLMAAIGKLRFIPPWPLPFLGFALWAMLGYHVFIVTMLFLVLVLWT